MLLYINGNYPHHSLHCELVSKLADLGNFITVFVPMKGTAFEKKYCCEHPKVQIIYKDCVKTMDRVFFLRKILRIVNIIEKEIDMTRIDSILAGTVYSDGLVAYMLSKKYNIPFSIAVRETDVTYQMKWRPYLNTLVKKLLERATNIIFISPAYRTYLDRFNCSEKKYVIIPNAVNDYWFSNRIQQREKHDPISIIYVGEISKRKNVLTTILAIEELKKRGINAVFHIVGTGTEEDTCKGKAKLLGIEKQVFFHGWQNGKDKIKMYYDQADIFVMPSYRETFGTVYVEAISQGIPIIYTKGQGIDGYFEDGSVGYKCNPDDPYEIATLIQTIMVDYHQMSERCINVSQDFSWEIIAKKYNNVIEHMGII